MATRRITQNTAITYDQVEATDVLLVGKKAVDRTITLPQTAKYVLGNVTIGGSATGDITTNAGTQTLTNKTLTTPNINGSLCEAEGSDLNKLLNIDTTQGQLNLIHGLTVAGTTLNYCSGLSGHVQTQLNSKPTRYSTVEKIVYNYSLDITAAEANYDISNSDILSYFGLSATTYRVDASSIIIQVYNLNTGSNTLQLNNSLVITTIYQPSGASKKDLSKINITGLEIDKDFEIIIHCKFNAYSGGS